MRAYTYNVKTIERLPWYMHKYADGYWRPFHEKANTTPYTTPKTTPKTTPQTTPQTISQKVSDSGLIRRNVKQQIFSTCAVENVIFEG